MEILINELSLSGQYDSVERFVKEALPHFISVLKEINPTVDRLYKKYDLYARLVVSKSTLHDVLTGVESRIYDEIRRSKCLLFGEADLKGYIDHSKKDGNKTLEL